MSKVEIDAGGRRVTVEHEGELAHLAETAQRLWQDTHAPERLSAGFGLHGHTRWEPAPVAGGAYSGRPRPRVTGEAVDA